MSLKTTATIENLYRVPENGKAELVNGELVIMAATGFLLGFAGGEITAACGTTDLQLGAVTACPIM